MAATIKAQISKLQSEYDEIIKESNKIKIEINKLKKKIKVACGNINCWPKGGCGKKFEIGTVTYIQTYWYESPYSCTAGDRWHPGEGNFLCPSCGFRNRFYNREEFEKLQPYFKETIKSYDD